jgi:tetratricopeptide (TPR) repeat protein
MSGNTSVPHPDHAEIHMHNGTTMYQAGAYIACIPLFEEILRVDPFNYRARYYLALSYFRQRMYDEAVEVYNSLCAKDDSEARLVCQLLARAFLLSEGNPLEDVRMLTAEESIEIREFMKQSPLLPEPFAHMLWHGALGYHEHCSIDLSILLGPGKRLLCVLPCEQTPFESEQEYDWLPVWTCSQITFDREAGKHLFFQRALQYFRDEQQFDWPPMYTSATFPSRQRQILLRRVYPEAPFTEIFDEL